MECCLLCKHYLGALSIDKIIEVRFSDEIVVEGFVLKKLNFIILILFFSNEVAAYLHSNPIQEMQLHQKSNAWLKSIDCIQNTLK